MAAGQFFTQRTGYGIHALAYMATKKTGELTTLPELTEWMKRVWPSASGSYLSTVVQRLARAGLLRSHRGIAGGYSLAHPADQITLRHLVEILEGVDFDRCSLSLESRCPSVGLCAIQSRLLQIETSYLKSLEQLTIAVLAEDICRA